MITTDEKNFHLLGHSAEPPLQAALSLKRMFRPEYYGDPYRMK